MLHMLCIAQSTNSMKCLNKFLVVMALSSFSAILDEIPYNRIVQAFAMHELVTMALF